MEEEPFLKTLQTNASQCSHFPDNKDRLRKIGNPQQLGAGRNCEKWFGPTHCLLVSECQNLSRQMGVWSFKSIIFYRVVFQPVEKKEREKTLLKTPEANQVSLSLSCSSPGKSLKQPSGPSQDEVGDPRANLSISPLSPSPPHRATATASWMFSQICLQLKYSINVPFFF